MDILWAPWRAEYIEKCGKKKGQCVFCAILKEKKDTKTFIFHRTEHSFAVLNIYPFNGGHVLVLPRRHVGDLADLASEERMDLMDTLLHVQKLLKKAFRPEAFNVGMNLGSPAGAGIPEHMHIHVVPRWKGDVNFMPAIFDTKVIPVSLKKVHKALTDANKGRNRRTGK